MSVWPRLSPSSRQSLEGVPEWHIGERRSSTVCTIVERLDHHRGDNTVNSLTVQSFDLIQFVQEPTHRAVSNTLDLVIVRRVCQSVLRPR